MVIISKQIRDLQINVTTTMMNGVLHMSSEVFSSERDHNHDRGRCGRQEWVDVEEEYPRERFKLHIDRGKS
jgi:hypothetical protein